MEFRSRSNFFSPRPKIKYPMTAPTYGWDFDKDTGHKRVIVTGSTNVFQLTQEALPDTLVYNLIDRINKTGDYSILGENLGGFIDVTAMPSNLLEASIVRAKTEQLFAALPSEERAKYGNDINVFVKEVNDKIRNHALAKRKEVVSEGGASDEQSSNE